MAKKKNQQNAPKPATFRTTPFSTLKGVIIASPSKTPEPPRPAAPPKPPAEDDNELFQQAMNNVKRLDGSISPAKKTTKQPQQSAAEHITAESTSEKDRIDSEIFTQAIGQLKLDVTFRDHAPEDEEIKPLGANRLRQLKRGVISVDRQLDLHGLTREEALEALPRFLQSASVHGEKAVLVITGKGNNSPAEPVLQQAVVAWLRDAGKKLVVEFAPAPREMGGSGAFVIFLRN